MFRAACVMTGLIMGATQTKPCWADQNFDLYVIVHGLQLGFHPSLPPWTVDLARSINSQLEAPENGNRIAQSVVTESGQDPWISKQFLVYDWAERSYNWATAISPIVTEPLYRAVQKRILKHVGMNGKPINIHLITHSRGSYVGQAVLNLLRQRRDDRNIGFLQWTILDPHPWDDGVLISNPGGIVDWQLCFFQSKSNPVGRPIAGVVNIDLTQITADLKWAMGHSEVHYWYHWMYLNGSEDIPYGDPVNKNIAENFRLLKGPDLREKLYKTSVIAENFNNSNELPFDFQGNENRKPQVVGGELVLTESKGGLLGRAFTKKGMSAPFMVDFTFRMDKLGGLEERYLGADGFTAVAIPQGGDLSSIIEDVGGNLGYKGVPGIGLAFDTYHNSEFGDPLDPWNYVSLRGNGSPMWGTIPGGGMLPERSNSGNQFRVIALFLEKEIRMRIYAYTCNRYVDITRAMQNNYISQDDNRFGFTAATAAGWQRHVIDDVMIAPIFIGK